MLSHGSADLRMLLHGMEVVEEQEEQEEQE